MNILVYRQRVYQYTYNNNTVLRETGAFIRHNSLADFTRIITNHTFLLRRYKYIFSFEVNVDRNCYLTPISWGCAGEGFKKAIKQMASCQTLDITGAGQGH